MAALFAHYTRTRAAAAARACRDRKESVSSHGAMQRIRPLSPGSLRQEAVGVHYSSRKEKVLGAVMAFVSGPLRPLSKT